MITKFKQYNESIKDLLTGPTKEEVWKHYGFDEPFDTPEEYFLDVFHGFNNSQIKHYFIWKDIIGNTVISYDTLNEEVVCYLGYYTKLMEKIFNLSYRDVINIINKILIKQLKLKNNIDITHIVSTKYHYDEEYEEEQ